MSEKTGAVNPWHTNPHALSPPLPLLHKFLENLWIPRGEWEIIKNRIGQEPAFQVGTSLYSALFQVQKR